MTLSVTARNRLAPEMRRYAEEKLERLQRHTTLHAVDMVIDDDPSRIPACFAEIIVHLHHTRLAAKVEAPTVQEAIDAVVDKADRQILRRKDRVTDHKGRPGAGTMPRDETDDDSPDDTAVLSERWVRLRPYALPDAVAQAEKHGDRQFLYLREESGDVALLVRRPRGGYDLMICDMR